jgi:putative lipoic acid-binding regulatory protein
MTHSTKNMVSLSNEANVTSADRMRRNLVLSLPAGVFLGLPTWLIGCGGNSTDSGVATVITAGTSANTQTSTVALSGPFAGRAGSTVLIKGVATPIGAGGRAEVLISSDSPAMVSLFDSASNLVLGHFLVNPVAAVQTFDADNMAMAVLFVALGGYQIPADQRQAALLALAKDPAVAGLSAAIATTITAKPTAYGTGDAAIISAVQQALKTVKVKFSNAQTPLAGASLLPATGPSTLGQEVMQTAQQVLQVKAVAPGAENYRLGTDSNPDVPGNAFALRPDNATLDYVFDNPTQVETALYFYRYGRQSEADADLSANSFHFVDPVEHLVGSPAQLSVPIPSETRISATPDNADDVQQLHILFVLRPIFGPDIDVRAVVSFRLESEYSFWRGAIADMYERAAAGLAMKLLAEVLGFGGHFWTTAEIKATMPGLRTVNAGMSAALLNARRGDSLPGSVLPILDAMTVDSTAATASIQALTPITNIEANADALRLASIVRNGVNAWKIFGIISDQNFNGPEALDLTTGHLSLESNTGTLTKVRVKVKASQPKYAPAGSTIHISVAIFNLDKLGFPATFHYKVVGSTTLRMTDNLGKNGLEFDSKSSTIDLITNPSTLADVLTVSVEVRGGISPDFLLGKGSVDILRGKLDQITFDVSGGVYPCSDPIACGVSEYTAFLVPVYPTALNYSAVLTGFAFPDCNRTVSWAGVKPDGGGCSFPVTYHPHSTAGPTKEWAVWVGFGGPIAGGKCTVTVTLVV